MLVPESIYSFSNVIKLLSVFEVSWIFPDNMRLILSVFTFYFECNLDKVKKDFSNSSITKLRFVLALHGVEQSA